MWVTGVQTCALPILPKWEAGGGAARAGGDRHLRSMAWKRLGAEGSSAWVGKIGWGSVGVSCDSFSSVLWCEQCNIRGLAMLSTNQSLTGHTGVSQREGAYAPTVVADFFDLRD